MVTQFKSCSYTKYSFIYTIWKLLCSIFQYVKQNLLFNILKQYFECFVLLLMFFKENQFSNFLNYILKNVKRQAHSFINTSIHNRNINS